MVSPCVREDWASDVLVVEPVMEGFLSGFVRRDDGEIGWASASLHVIPKDTTA